MGYSTLTVKVDVHKHVGTIQFCRPKQLNSFIGSQYKELRMAVAQLDSDDDVHVLLLTGSGRFYSSGHDLTERPKAKASETPRQLLKRQTKENAGLLIESIIALRKPLIIGVNGPAVGVAVTLMSLADVVYASETATFTTPFMKLGFCAEGCSSVTFPEIMGHSKANEMLLMGKTLTAEEAERCGFVASVLPGEAFQMQVLAKAESMAAFPPQALRDTKSLRFDVPIAGPGSPTRRQHLVEVSRTELNMLVERMLSKECAMAMQAFARAQLAKRREKKAKL